MSTIASPGKDRYSIMSADVTAGTLRTLSLARSFDTYAQSINALSFTDDSRFLLASADDASLSVYNVEDGVMVVKCEGLELGVGKVSATHHNHAVLYCSTRSPNVCYYNWNLSRAIWQSSEHSSRVVSLSVSPSSDSFLSVSTDYRLLYSDLRQRRAVFGCWLKDAEGTAAAAFDPAGVVFGLAYPKGESALVKLFDSRKPEPGPFLEKQVPGEVSVTNLEFSDDGLLVMLNSANSQIAVLDAFSLNVNQCIALDLPPEAASVGCFSACGKYILTGTSHHGEMTIFESESGKVAHKLVAPGPIHAVSWCKKFFLLATGGLTLGLWLPDLDEAARTEN